MVGAWRRGTCKPIEILLSWSSPENKGKGWEFNRQLLSASVFSVTSWSTEFFRQASTYPIDKRKWLTITKHRTQCLRDQRNPGMTSEIKVSIGHWRIPGGRGLRRLELELAGFQFV